MGERQRPGPGRGARLSLCPAQSRLTEDGLGARDAAFVRVAPAPASVIGVSSGSDFQSGVGSGVRSRVRVWRTASVIGCLGRVRFRSVVWVRLLVQLPVSVIAVCHQCLERVWLPVRGRVRLRVRGLGPASGPASGVCHRCLERVRLPIWGRFRFWSRVGSGPTPAPGGHQGVLWVQDPSVTWTLSASVRRRGSPAGGPHGGVSWRPSHPGGGAAGRGPQAG